NTICTLRPATRSTVPRPSSGSAFDSQRCPGMKEEVIRAFYGLVAGCMCCDVGNAPDAARLRRGPAAVASQQAPECGRLQSDLGSRCKLKGAPPHPPLRGTPDQVRGRLFSRREKEALAAWPNLDAAP